MRRRRVIVVLVLICPILTLQRRAADDRNRSEIYTTTRYHPKGYMGLSVRDLQRWRGNRLVEGSMNRSRESDMSSNVITGQNRGIERGAQGEELSRHRSG